MKFIIWLGKVILMFGILVAAATGWIFLVSVQYGGGSGSAPAPWVIILDWIFMLATFVLYIFLCVKISRLGTEKPEKSDSFWKKAKQPLLIIVPVILMAMGYMLIDPAMDLIAGLRAKYAVRTADEIIEYQNDHAYGVNGGIFNTGIKRDSIVINYDKKTVSFIFSSGYERRVFKKFVLKKGEIDPKQHLQYIAKLSSPGKTFSTYNNGEASSSSLTTGIRIEMEDGSVYSAEFETEFLAMLDHTWIGIMNVQENADIVINYGRNSLKENYFGIESNTLFIDTDTNTFSVLYGDKLSVSCSTFELVPTDRVEDIYLQAKIDLDIGTFYTYTGKIYDEQRKDRTDGMILINDDGIFTIKQPVEIWGNWDFYNSEYRCSEDHVNITANGIEYIN